MKIYSFLQIAALFCVMLAGCSFFEEESSPTNYIVYPKTDLRFDLFPNDAAISDSMSANLAYGAVLHVTPGTSFKLSFDVEGEALPEELLLFRSFEKNGNYYYQIVRRLEGRFENGKMTYEFDCAENVATAWFTVLRGEGASYFNGRIKNVKYEGEGPYPATLSLNLVVAGEYTGTKDSVSVDSLAKALKNKFVSTYRLSIDTIYVSYAADHANGAKFPVNRPFVAPYSLQRTDIDDALSSLSEWDSKAKSGALDFVLVHRIDGDGVLGYSPLFGGSTGNSGNVIILSTHITYGSSSIEQLSSADILRTAVHETGHFFGLRHTTSTYADVQSTHDYSVKEDGIEDTPWCPGIALRQLGLLNEKVNSGNVMYGIRLGYTISYECPDSKNIMFPYDQEEYDLSFSAMQLEMVKKNLTLIVH